MTTSPRARRTAVAFFLCLCLFAINVRTASATHFYGGSITWQKDFNYVDPVNDRYLITFQASWRWSFAWNPAFPALNTQVSPGAYAIVITDQNTGQSVTQGITQTVIAINQAEDWFVGQYTFAFIAPKGHVLVLDHQSSARSSTLLEGNHDASWRLTTTIDPTKATRSPSSTMLPRMYLQQNQAASFFIPSTAFDGNTNQFSFASQAESSLVQIRPIGVSSCTLNGSGQCTQCNNVADNSGPCFFGMQLSPAGFVTWTPQTIGLYAVQVKITSFDAGLNAKASTPLDFLIDVVASCPTCATPVVTAPSTASVVAGHALSIPISVTESNAQPGTTVSLANTPLPSGATLSNPPNPSTPPYTVNLNWTPTAAQVGNTSVCFQATDSNLHTSYGQACTSITVTANHAPGVQCTAAVTVPAVGPLGAPANLLWGVSDQEQDPLTAKLYIDNNLSETFSIASLPGFNVIRNYSQQIGPRSYRLEVSDGFLTTSCETVVTVDKLTQTVSFPQLGPYTLGDPAITLQASSSAPIAPVFQVLSGPGHFFPPNQVGFTGAGSVEVKATFPGGPIYYDAAASQFITVNRAMPSLSVTGGTFAYDGAAHPATGVEANGIGGVGLSPVSVTYNGSNTPPTAAGHYDVVASFAGDANFLPASKTTTIDITNATLTATVDPSTRLYGAANPAFSVSYSGFAPGDNAAIVTGTPVFATAAVANTGVGLVPVSASAGSLSAPNYDITFVPGNLIITPAPLTATADSASRAYGAGDPAFTASYSGFVAGDSASVIVGVPTFTNTANAGSPVGTYAINITGGISSPNYTIGFAPGVLTVTQSALTIGVANVSKTYGDPNPSFTLTYSGFAGQDGPGSVSGVPVFTTAATSASGVGVYPVSVNGLSSMNYSISYITGNLTVLPATLVATASNATRLYGAADPPFAATYSGFVNGDGAGAVTGSPTFATTAVINSPVGSYPITVTGGVSAANYMFAFAPGSLAITPAPLTIGVAAASRQYGTPNPAFTATFSGLVAGDTAASIGGTAVFTTTATQFSALGTYPVSVTGLSSPNYTITFTDGALTVTDVTTPGEMNGDGFVRDDENRYQFKFRAREDSVEKASISLRIDGEGKKKTKKRDDRFDSRTVTFIAFSDDPTIIPGKPAKPQVDTVRFGGVGEWNGQAGYRYEVVAQDAGEPGKNRESMTMTIWSPTGQVVASFSGDLDGGNIQSKRIKH